MKIDKQRYISTFVEIGNYMMENDTNNVDLEISTPLGTLVFDITIKVKEEDNE